MGYQVSYAQVNNRKVTRNMLTDSILYSGNNTQLNDSTKLYVLEDYTQRKFASRRDQRRYDRLVFIVKKVYPLAKLAGQRMEEYAAATDTLKRHQVKEFVAEIEDEVKNKYGEDLRRLTFKEGVVLLKLLDRQTSKTPYIIIKELKDGFSAILWQSLASLFDYNLKDEYNPNDVQEDQWIEDICVLIEQGKL